MDNLIILGAGQFGLMVNEIAKSTGMYNKIDFLDDMSPIAIGKLDELLDFAEEYNCVVVAIGNPDIRQSYFEKARYRFKIVSVISPLAAVSNSATIGVGTIIEPMAVVQTGAIVGEGCIISSGAVIRHNGELGSFCHADCNSVVMSNSAVPSKTKVTCLTVYRNN